MVDDFNRDAHAYSFGFAAMSWFTSRDHVIGFTIIVLLVLWRREFHSRTLQVLSD